MENNSYAVAVLGAGNIGSAVISRLQNLDNDIVQLFIKKVLVTDLSKDREIDKELLTDNFDEILNDDSIDLVIEVLGVISSYVKKMTKAVEEYKSLGDRGVEMADKIQFEIDFLSGWLPEQLSEEDVAKLVDEVLADLGDVDMSQVGRIIGAVMAKGDGIDGSVVSKLVKEKLS